MAQFLLFFIAIAFIVLFVKVVFYHINEGDSLAKLEEANRQIGELKYSYETSMKALETKCNQYNELRSKFEKLQHQKISADVKMGQKSENLLPFLSQFPYPTEDIRGLFNPIDLIAFTDDEVIFIEVKSGNAQLSEKQRRIRDNIKAGRVRFETHRMNEKGVTVK